MTLANIIEKRFVRVGDIQLHTVFAGDDKGAPVFLLHGFPEFWYGWKHQIPYLAERGYRVIAPDQRGYNLSDKPRSVEDYSIGTLARDVVGLADALGYDQINLVGHDWGAAVAWWVATMFPERLQRLIILNVPHPVVMAQSYRAGNIGQLLKSWYIGFFQIPGLSDALMSVNDYMGLTRMMRMSSHEDTFSAADIEQYKIAWSQKHAVTSMINWYRALGRSFVSNATNSPNDTRAPIHISTPTLMLWGEQDIALGKELAQLSLDLCADGELILFPQATHWLQHDEADAVNERLHTFLQS